MVALLFLATILVAAAAPPLAPASKAQHPVPPREGSAFHIESVLPRAFEPLVLVRITGAKKGSDVVVWLQDDQRRLTTVETRAQPDGTSQVQLVAQQGAYTVLAESVWADDSGRIHVDVAPPRRTVVKAPIVPAIPSTRRTVSVDLIPKQARARAEIQLPRQDPRVTALLEGRLRTEMFVDDVLDCMRLSREGSPGPRTIGQLVSRGTRNIVLHQSSVIVTAQGDENSVDESLLPTLRGAVRLSVPGCGSTPIDIGSLPSKDELNVQLHGYVASTVDPNTTDISGTGAYRWTDYGLSKNQPITIGLTFNPVASPENLRSFLQATIFSFIRPEQHWIASWLNVFRGVLLGLPMIVFIVWCCTNRSIEDRARVTGMRWCAFVQGAISVSPFVFQAMTSGEASAPGPSPLQPVFEGLIATAGILAATLLVRLAPKELAAPRVIAFALTCAASSTLLYTLIATIAVLNMRADPKVAEWLIGAAIVFVSLSSCFRRLRIRRARWNVPMLVGLAMFSLALALPLGLVQWSSWYVRAPVPDVVSVVTELLNAAAKAAPLLFAFPLIRFISRLRTQNQQIDRVSIARLLFAVYAVLSWQNIVLIPVTFIFALLSSRVLIGGLDVPAYSRVRRTLKMARRAIVERALELRQLWQIGDAMQEVRGKFLAGNLDAKTYRSRRTEIERYSRLTLRSHRSLSGMSPARIALAFGPYDDESTMGWTGFTAAGVFAVLDVVLFLPLAVQQQDVVFSPYPVATIAAWLAAIVGQRLVAGFFFGYAFPMLLGESGIKKALLVASFVVLSSSICWLVNFPAVIVGIMVVETFLFYALLGFWFDYLSIREGLQERFKVQYVAQLSGVPSLAAVAAIVASSVGVVVTSFVQGHVAETLSAAARALSGHTFGI